MSEAMTDLADHLRAKRQRDLPFNDEGNARRLVELHGEKLRYVPGLGWHCWDGSRWQRDDTREVERCAKATIENLRREAAGIDDREASAKLWTHAYRSGNRPRIEAMVRLAESDLAVVAKAEQLDADAWLLNVVNGTLDLRTGELRPHRRDDLLTKRAPVEHDAAAEAPRWAAFLEQVLPEPDARRYVQRAAGYSLTGETSEQCLFLPHGGGANGKTTFIETLAAVLGDYAEAADASSFTTGHRRIVRSDLARLRGARLVTAVEIEGGARLAEVLVKQITGGDRIVAAHLYREEFAYRPTFKLWLAVNDLPDVRGRDIATWRRLRVLPFPRRIERPDRQLPAKLRDELPGIFAWAVQGCLAWQRQGLAPPPTVLEATAAYREATDPLGDCITECIDLDPTAFTPSGDLYAAYHAWADAAGIRDIREPLTQTQLTRHLARLDGCRLKPGRVRGRQLRGIHGLAVRGDAVTPEIAETTDFAPRARRRSLQIGASKRHKRHIALKRGHR